jgi:hypothetical protein
MGCAATEVRLAKGPSPCGLAGFKIRDDLPMGKPALAKARTAPRLPLSSSPYPPSHYHHFQYSKTISALTIPYQWGALPECDEGGRGFMSMLGIAMRERRIECIRSMT